MAARWAKTLVFLLAAAPVGALALGVLIAGWVAVSSLAITPLVVPALVAYRAVVGGVARLDAELAAALLGTTARPRLVSPGRRGFWRVGGNVLRDGSFWRQQAYLGIRLSLGFGIAVFEWSLVAASLGLVSVPVWYRFTDAQVVWHVDTLGRALLCVPLGLAGLAAAAALLDPLRRLSRRLVDALLADPGEGDALTMAEQRRALAVHAYAYVAFNLVLIAIWALSSRGTFWPVWTLIALGLPLALHASSVLVETRRLPRAFALHLAASAALAVFFVLIWAASGRHGSFWPVWPMLALVIVLLPHAGVVLAQRRSSDRIAVLEESRAGAVEEQESELERIERDLHDGAQARLVALGMSLGMAEQKLASDPAAAQALLAEARAGTREALEELRSLARGIHPPVLADRGLEAAIRALADRTPIRVDVAVDVDVRPPRTVESAAYFVVAEALANVGKHAGAQHVDVRVRSSAARVLVDVTDDGVGGADPEGSGLRGLTRRVEALDGRLEVSSPPGGPTTIRAVIPCGS